MRKQASWIFACCFAVVLLGGCTTGGSLFHSPLGKGSIAKQAEKDPFPTASQVGLAQKEQK